MNENWDKRTSYHKLRFKLAREITDFYIPDLTQMRIDLAIRVEPIIQADIKYPLITEFYS